ncbi:MAG: putative porin [Syntrophobacteraceae bacterium]
MLRGMVVLGIVALIWCVCATNAFCEEGKAAEPTGMEMLEELLKAKGVISPDEAAALRAKITGAESPESVKALVDLLKNKGLVSDGEADRLNQALAKTTPATQAAAKAILVVPRDQEYVQKITQNVVTEVKKNIDAQVETEVAQKAKDGTLGGLAANVPDWLQKLQFSGDIRLRYEPVFYPSTNGLILDPNNPTSRLRTTLDSQAEYVLARLKVETSINDQVTLGVRLASGNQTNPGSDNSIMGDYFIKDGFLLDQAYLRYRPIPDLSIWGGRIPNPWFYTDLIWANDLNFEGVAANYQRNICSDVTGFVTGGAFPLQAITEVTQSEQKWLLGGQAGIEYKPDRQYSFKLGVALYDYENTLGMVNPVGQTVFDWTAPLYMQKGNTVVNVDPLVLGGNQTQRFALASKFRDLDIDASLDIACWDPVHVVLSGDYVQNIAFNAQKVSQLSGRPVAYMQDDAYRAGLLVGYPTPRKFLQWNVFTYYKYVGTDSVVDAFDDQDFALGGTNAKGWILGAELGLMKNVWLTARWFTSDQISPFQNSTGPFSVDVFEFDTHAAF